MKRTRMHTGYLAADESLKAADFIAVLQAWLRASVSAIMEPVFSSVSAWVAPSNDSVQLSQLGFTCHEYTVYQ